MPKINPNKDKEKKKRAVKLYQEGLTLREVGKLINRSYEWVRQVIKSYPQDDLLDNE